MKTFKIASAVGLLNIAILFVMSFSLSHRWQVSIAEAGMMVIFLFGCAAIVILPILVALNRQK